MDQEGLPQDGGQSVTCFTIVINHATKQLDEIHSTSYMDDFVIISARNKILSNRQIQATVNRFRGVDEKRELDFPQKSTVNLLYGFLA